MSDLGNKEILAQNLEYYMNINHKDRNDISRDLEIPYTTVTSWLKAEFYPRIDKIQLLANYFGIQKSDLVEKQIDKGKQLNEPNQYVLDLYNSLSPANQLETVRYMRFLKASNKTIEPKIQILGQTAAGKPIEYGDSYAQDIDDISKVPKGTDFILTVNR